MMVKRRRGLHARPRDGKVLGHLGQGEGLACDRAGSDTIVPEVLTISETINTNGWRVVGGFVIDTELLAPYVYECPLPVTPIGRLLDGLRAA
jgi:hypothetical protein